ncbi:hypothetical protein D3C71_1267780 [compost metagenome]
MRTWYGTRRASWLWQEIRPHSSPSHSTETDIDAPVPMLRMYCRCTGETLRSMAGPRSVGGASAIAGTRTSGTGV